MIYMWVCIYTCMLEVYVIYIYIHIFFNEDNKKAVKNGCRPFLYKWLYNLVLNYQ